MFKKRTVFLINIQMSKEFFRKFKECERKSGLTQAQIASMLDISTKQLQNYGSKTLPPHDKLIELNRVFKTNLSVYIYQEKVPININNNSDPPQDLIKEKDTRIKEQSITIALLQEKVERLEKQLSDLNVEPSKKTGTGG